MSVHPVVIFILACLIVHQIHLLYKIDDLRNDITFIKAWINKQVKK